MGTVFGSIPLGGSNGYRRFASRVLPLGSINDKHRLPLLASAKRCCLAHATAWRKEKKRTVPPAAHPFGRIVPVPEIAGASLFAARQESLREQDPARQRSLNPFTMLENARRFPRRCRERDRRFRQRTFFNARNNNIAVR
ncbi:MAG: hypothetical protein ACR2KT_15605 [Methylocella sp.]